MEKEHVAIYLCGHCGGYDGNPIGVRIIFTDETVHWKELGYYSDIDDDINEPFDKVREYSFSKQEYIELVQKMKKYEP